MQPSETTTDTGAEPINGAQVAPTLALATIERLERENRGLMTRLEAAGTTIMHRDDEIARLRVVEQSAATFAAALDTIAEEIGVVMDAGQDDYTTDDVIEAVRGLVADKIQHVVLQHQVEALRAELQEAERTADDDLAESFKATTRWKRSARLCRSALHNVIEAEVGR